VPETAQGGARPDPLGRALARLCGGLAVLGGLVLVALIVMTCETAA